MQERAKVRIAIYSRKSKYSDKGDSVGNQIEIAKEYIKLHFPESTYEVSTFIYEDEGFSGGSFERPEFKKFLEEERRNPFHVLICYRLDRISRNIADFSGLINELSSLHTSFVSIKEQFDTKTPMGRAMMYIASVFAQLEREVIAERIRDNLLELAKTGTWLGGEPPLGFVAKRYKKISICQENGNGLVKKNKMATRLTVNKSEIAIVKLIFSKYQELKSLTKLETYLIEHDIKTRKRVYYSITSLKGILSNLVYAKNDKDILQYYKEKGIHIYCENDQRNKFDGSYGFLTFNKTSGKKVKPIEEWIIAVGLQEGIIPGKEWIAVQKLLEKNMDKCYRAVDHVKKQSIVSGLIKCRNCGSYMRPRNIEKKRADGSVNYRYCCKLKEKSRGQKCKGLNVKGEALDNQILHIIKETFVPNLEIYKELQKMTIQESIRNKELDFLEKAYRENQEEIENLVEKMKYIDIDLIEIINDNLRRLKEKKKELETKIAILQANTKKENCNLKTNTKQDVLDMINGSFSIFDTFDLKIKREITRLLIEDILGNGEEIEINFSTTQIDETSKEFLSTLTKK